MVTPTLPVLRDTDMSTTIALGRLQQVPLREAWQSESTDFTPWLAAAENLALLGDVIGLSLEMEATEQEVGPFRADVVCRNLADESLVLIENQIERTDHSHLGQLLTYAAGLDAVTVVWIAERFTDEHRAALDWLNSITETKFNFFGLEIELWRIGSSPPAPKFNVVCQPNDWTRTTALRMAAAESLSPTKKLQQAYWVEFRQKLTESGSPLRSGAARSKPVLPFALGRSAFGLWAVITSYNPVDNTTVQPSLRVQLTIEHPESEGLFRALVAQKASIEHQLGEALVWIGVEEAQRRKRAFLWTPANLEDRTDWPRQHQWLQEKLEKMLTVFAPIVRYLQPLASEVVGSD